MIVNDLLKLLTLRDKVLVTDDSTGENLYEGYVEDLPSDLKALTPHGFAASADYFDCYDITYVIEVVDE